MSNVLLEGGAMEEPLIGPNITRCKEIIEEGVNGYLFETKNIDDLEKKTTEFLRRNKKAREEMGKASRKRFVNEFIRNIVINGYIRVIEE